MLKLNDRKWNEFFIGGKDGEFQIRASLSGIDKNKLQNCLEKNIPYVTRSDINNGINIFVGEKQLDKYSIDNANVITIGLDTQTAFYQPHKFYTGQNIQILYNKKLNRYNALFIVRLLKQQLSKFSWGGNGATLGRLNRTKILLPVNDEGKPDYQFMEDFIKEIETRKRKEYSVYCAETLEKLGGVTAYKKILNLNEIEWKEIFISDIFEIIQRGKRLTRDKQQNGEIPYVSSSSLNNGVDNFICNINKVRKFDNCLSLANSGSVGSCFYEPFEFVASDHVTHLKNKKYNKYIYLFIATMLNRLSEKYNFNREINDERIKREKILLPINSNKEIDYEYMEQYVKNDMIEKYQSYLNYISA